MILYRHEENTWFRLVNVHPLGLIQLAVQGETCGFHFCPSCEEGGIIAQSLKTGIDDDFYSCIGHIFIFNCPEWSEFIAHTKFGVVAFVLYPEERTEVFRHLENEL